MAAKKKTKRAGNGAAHDDAVVAELKRIYEEIRALGTRTDLRTDAVTARLDVLTMDVRAQGTELRAQGAELRAVRDLLVDAAVRDRRRIETLEVRVSTLEAGKH